MSLDPAAEPPIDVSLNHYMEEKALALALSKAGNAEQRSRVEHLINLRVTLMGQRDNYAMHAVAKRHARGEIYSKARVAAINAMGPGRADLDSDVKSLYMRQPDSVGVLKAHARTHFAAVLVSQRLSLAVLPADIVQEAREMQQREEAFATAWIDAVNDSDFVLQIQKLRREALALFRTATRPMYLVTYPPLESLDDEDAIGLGKSWSKLDSLASALGATPLSEFIAFGDEGESAGIPAQDILPSILALLRAVANPGQKFASKKKTLLALGKVLGALERLKELNGRAFFEVDS